MESSDQKSLEKVLSQKALQMGSSSPCQICVVGFLCVVCLTSLFLAALTSFGAFQFEGISFSTFSSGIFATQSSQYAVTGNDCNPKQKEKERIMYAQKSDLILEKDEMHDRVKELYSVWSRKLSTSTSEDNQLPISGRLGELNTPKAPHLENCKLRAEVNSRLDSRIQNESFPPWTIWKGMLNDFPSVPIDEEQLSIRRQLISEGPNPPWVAGSDDENYPLTRKAQRDIWFHQHPANCRDPNVKFLVADWERLPGFGIGAQIAGMCGLLAIAIKEKRVLVTNYYNRADHDGCKGTSRSSWSCYFVPETSQECRERAFELMESKEAQQKGMITVKENYTSKEIWAGRIPSILSGILSFVYSRFWGNPWSYLQPTTEVNGSLIANHRKMDRRWWRAQAVRYLMRFQSEYTCNLLNIARHEAFGWEAAKMAVSTTFSDSTEDVAGMRRFDIEKFVWSNHKPWIPRPLLSMHVRMGDKACEMKVVGFREYMHLAERIRKRFPHLSSIWLSTEMQEVIEQSKLFPNWNIYYTKVARQEGNITMATYEASLGRETSTNYPLVNFLMASEADFFIGALGSTWCYLIDGMRNTGGKVMSGYLSVNKDRFW
ncbi:OLC1v1026550C1 [Oldenlandia corymbosa var. corymbosa]|uniref:OLC1v1026550C1 n=1 Tax=Oldenlandia corymbosa var. corymbosa TaxID=529605 RepID=A0AAV1CAB0_OLDCO|nr:OLC1v1026550C1 [Oldenlandia corymbosa var. corymbosa]